MTPTDLLNELTHRGVILEPIGDRLRYKAPVGVLTPELKQALAAQKAALVQLLTGEGLVLAAPKLPDDSAFIALKVWSTILDAAIWVVADDLPKEAWPEGALTYTHEEVKILRQIGQDTVAWVHATKQMFGAQVIAGGRRRCAHPEAPA
jgi:hypothetical protein